MGGARGQRRRPAPRAGTGKPKSPNTLPVVREAREQARRRDVGLVIPATAQAIGVQTESTGETNAICT